MHKHLVPQESIIILGLSGGPDSVFLLHLLADMKKSCRIKDVIAAHLDHGWRTDSYKDVEFCQQLAAHYNVSFVSDHLDTFKDKIRWNGSKDDFGRKGRHLFFKKVMETYQGTAIALAHHRDDQLETFFIRLIRGTSLTGLCGMRAVQGSYIRPLLHVSKAAIINYLTIHSIAYLTDPTNASEHYLRNRIRNSVVPALQTCDERFDSNSIKTIERLQQVEDYLKQETVRLLNILQHEHDGIIYDHLLTQPPFMQYRLLIEWLSRMKVPFPVSETFFKEIIRFLNNKKNRSHTILKEWLLTKKQGIVRISKSQ